MRRIVRILSKLMNILDNDTFPILKLLSAESYLTFWMSCTYEELTTLWQLSKRKKFQSLILTSLKDVLTSLELLPTTRFLEELSYLHLQGQHRLQFNFLKRRLTDQRHRCNQQLTEFPKKLIKLQAIWWILTKKFMELKEINLKSIWGSLMSVILLWTWMR